MAQDPSRGSVTRRELLALAAASTLGGAAFLATGKTETRAASGAQNLIHRNERPSMAYKRLGRTNFLSSRLVFGGGAALAGGRGVRLLERAFEAGINHFDVGSDIVYRGAERSLAPFLKKHRGELWVASKAPAAIWGFTGERLSATRAKAAASRWSRLMEKSLKDLGAEHIDLYYVMGVSNPALIRAEEIYRAFQRAKADGKVDHFGLSTHSNAQKVLEAAVETGWYDVAMIGITPAGWYDWNTKDIVEGTPTLVELQPLLKKAREAGMGLIGMKAVRYLAPMNALGRGDPTAYDGEYDEAFLKNNLSPFQRAYVYVLENGLDVVNADMQNFRHLEENIDAAANSKKHFDSSS